MNVPNGKLQTLNTSLNQTSVQINVLPFSEYEILVQADSVSGRGNLIRTMVVTEESGTAMKKDTVKYIKGCFR